MHGENASWIRSGLGYLLVLGSTVLWLLAPLPWWLPDISIAARALGGALLIALAELSFHCGLWALPAEEASHFHRWARVKRVFHQLFG